MPLAAKTEALRRTPSQARSRERVEKMLAAARDLIAEKGADALRMGEVAERAQVSIGSLYQFFPDKAAVIRTLAERYNAQGRACIADGLAGITDIAGLRTAFAALIDSYYGIFLSEPVMRDIWSGVQADPALRDLDREDSRINGAVLAGVMARLRPAADRAALEASAFLVMQLGEATMRLAVSVGPEEGRRLVEIYKRMALAEIAGP
ncbi:MAG: TetR family transcriptional regulator [Alphaproteobacteria bacterium]|jgi:AcrR family transcriptional regulator|nr:TetR family transcriptional regulator [Alphaproteobacteria bacterium]